MSTKHITETENVDFLKSSELWDNRELGASMEHTEVSPDSEQIEAMLKIVEVSSADELNGTVKTARDLLAERKAGK